MSFDGIVRTSIARIRFNVDFDHPADPRGAVALAIAEVLDPASDTVDVNEGRPDHCRR
jgi:hypothetical protein